MRTALLSLALISTAAAQPAVQQAAPTYARDIAPILEERCTGCHATSVKMGSLVTDNYE